MSDSISREDAIDALRKMQTYKLFSGDDMLLIDQAGAMTELMLLPTAEPQERIGHWRIRESFDDTVAKCSECGFEMLVNQSGNGLHDVEDLVYCPNCGADMRGEQNEP